ncbi:948_t:CDS:2, partial [Gigaspora margarita]
PLDDKQIPAALDFILEYIITKDKEKKDYIEWLNIKTEIKKYCRKGSKLERVRERRPWSLKARRKVPMNYQKIVSKREPEEFYQKKEEKVYTEPKEIVDSKALEFLLEVMEEYFYLMPSQTTLKGFKKKKPRMYLEVDLPGTRSPVAAPKVLYEKEKEEEISDKASDYEELLQKVLNICNALSKEIVQIKEKTT